MTAWYIISLAHNELNYLKKKKIPSLLTGSAGGCFIFRYKHVKAKYTRTALIEE